MTLYFITGNKHKFEEFDEILSPQVKVYQLEAELDEIQSISPQEVIKHKLIEAMKYHTGELLVEDTSVLLEALELKLPGPLIKWFIKALGKKGIYEMVKKIGLFGAEAKVILGYSNGREITFFEGTIKGKIVSPRGESSFDWDPIFLPECQTKTFAEMSRQKKNSMSARGIAVRKFKEFYIKKK